jgi:zinc transporter 1/2/3
MKRMLVARQVATDAKPSCGRAVNGEDYNLDLHIAAVFIILFVSSTACAFPLIVVKAPRLRIPPTFLFVVRHFGTGVLIATAFVHLLPTAFISLTDPCLPDFWNKDYPAMAGALALAAVFMIAVVEMVFSPGKNGCAMPAGMMEESIGGGHRNETAKEGSSVGNQEGERRKCFFLFCSSP